MQSYPAVSSEFEIETELSIFTARMRLPSGDFPTLFFSLFGIVSALGLLGLGLVRKEIANLKYENRCFSYLANR